MAPQPERKIAVEKKTVTREPGAIWTEASSWNALFTDLMPRKSGDLLKVRFSDSFRMSMMKRLKKDLAKGKLDLAMDDADLALQIQEVYPNGIFSVTGDRKIRFADEHVQLKVAATVREKDLAKDDSLSWDQLYNLNWTITAGDKT